jgi:hypothetical protein
MVRTATEPRSEAGGVCSSDGVAHGHRCSRRGDRAMVVVWQLPLRKRLGLRAPVEAGSHLASWARLRRLDHPRH